MEKHKESQKLYNRNGKPFVEQTSQTKSIISKMPGRKYSNKFIRKSAAGRGGGGEET